ncbi:MAG TPA: ParB/RepB/Spo0J family partition protein [Longimicrobiales bacterium]|nr:ParB/RepB/Spo0J family partition protein [Longimicrobiales bacterium]
MSRLIPVANIERHPDADLFPHDEEQIERLRADIAERGINTPLHVYPLANDRYLLLAGHDRLEAAKRAGLTEVPADLRSMLNSEAERFEYFVKDNTVRKDIDKRAAAKAVWLRYPQSTVQQIAERAGVSTGTAYNAREDALRDRPELFKVEKLEGADGKERPRTYTPREPKVVDIAERRKPEPVPSKVDQLREMREKRAAEAERATPTPSPATAAPAGPDVPTLEGSARREFRDSPTGRMHAYRSALPALPDLTDSDIADIQWDPASRDLLALHRDFIDRLLTKEADRASA